MTHNELFMTSANYIPEAIMPKITFLAVEGCLSSSISNMIDAFTIANLWHKTLSGERKLLFETEVIARDDRPILSSGCMQIHPHRTIAKCNHTDYLLIPAILPVPESRQMRDSKTMDFLCNQYASGVRIAAMCTGAFLLAETGLLNEKRATTNWQFEKKFRYRYPKVNLVIESILTEEDNLICTGAATAIMNLALHIIEREGSTRLASCCAKAMLVDTNRKSQAPYLIHSQPVTHRDREIYKAERYLHDHLSKNISLDYVAGIVCLSPRHFKRRFKSATGITPLHYLQKLRVETAKKMLENTLDDINEITRQVGYEDSSTFRRLFKKHTRLSPREYRDKFLRLKK